MQPIVMPPLKKAKRIVTLEQKGWFLDQHRDHPGWKHGRLAFEFQKQYGGDLLKTSTISDWLKPDAQKKVREWMSTVASGGKRTDQTYRKREPLCKALETTLARWMFEKEKQDGRITDDVLVMKARQLSTDFPELLVPDDFGFSRGWLAKFKGRYGIRSIELHGEANGADMTGVFRARQTLAKVLSNFTLSTGEIVNFAPDNIFNMDETGLFWRQQPSRSLVATVRAGSKKVMERVTLGLACNMTGTEKLRPIARNSARSSQTFYTC